MNEYNHPRGLARLAGATIGIRELEEVLFRFRSDGRPFKEPMSRADGGCGQQGNGPATMTSIVGGRPGVRGKFSWIGEHKFQLRRVTCGTFRPDRGVDEFPSRDMVQPDFEMMHGNGVNAVRTYTPPPRWILDGAMKAGLPVERSVAFLDNVDCRETIERMVRPPSGRIAPRTGAGSRPRTVFTPRSSE